MENFDVNPLDAMNQYNDIDLIYSTFNKKTHAQKFKYYLKRIFEKLEVGVLILSFFYLPIYIFLLFYKHLSIVSTFSLCYLLCFGIFITFFIMLNREENTFR